MPSRREGLQSQRLRYTMAAPPRRIPSRMTKSLAMSPADQDSLAQDELFPIREVSRLTGINPITLRAWERRYGLIRPTRTLSGHRLYSRADIEQVRSIQIWIQRGIPVSKVSDVLSRTRARPVLHTAIDLPGRSQDCWETQLTQALDAFDGPALERIYGQLLNIWPIAQVFVEILLPLWQSLRRDTEAFGGTSQWLFFDSFLRARAQLRLQLGQAQPPEALVLLAALPGQCLELELLVQGLLLSNEDLVVRVLALGQPLEELGLLCDRMQPQGLVLYGNHPMTLELQRQLERLAQGVDCPLALSGEITELSPLLLTQSGLAGLSYQQSAGDLQAQLRHLLSL